MILKQIVIKNYQEFADEVQIVDDLAAVEYVIIAKEVEAVCQSEDDKFFSIGFSVQRDSPLFEIENPRDMIRKFLTDSFNMTGINEPPSA